MTDYIERALEIHLSRITPSRTQMNAARSANQTLRAHLESDGYYGSLIASTFLNGSYARHTGINPIRDVDIMVVVDGSWADDAPEAAMKSLRRCLAKAYPDRKARVGRRAVKVFLAGMSLDVVLAAEPRGEAKPLMIPDRKEGAWLETHPRLQLELTRELQRATDGNYTRLTRLLKSWSQARMPSHSRPPSFLMECCVYAVLAEDPDSFSGPLSESFALLVEKLVEWSFGRADTFFTLSPIVPDPALPDVNVAEHWSTEAADVATERLGRELERIGKADRAHSDRRALEHWGLLFGGRFPGQSTVLRA